MISIVDYGVGNLRSVQKAFESLGFEAEITGDLKRINDSKAIILPGVGAFPDAIHQLRDTGIYEVIIDAAQSGKPILGICLGMQLLFEYGYEIEKCEGLGLIKGSVKKLEGEIKIPHMGWNNIRTINNCAILKEVIDDSYVYFVHSFYAEVIDGLSLNSVTHYGSEIPAVVSKGNIYGTQFHPEKSGKVGMKILQNFGELIQ